MTQVKNTVWQRKAVETHMGIEQPKHTIGADNKAPITP